MHAKLFTHLFFFFSFSFAFISMGNPDKALTLNGSYLEGMRLEVTMATKRSEYYGYTNHRGCQRCGIASAKRLAKRFYDRTRIRIPLGTSFFSFIFESLKENNSYTCDYFYRLHSVPSDF